MKRIWCIPILLAALIIIGCGNPVNTDDVLAPTVISTLPADATTNVVRNRSITATFSEAMDATTVDVVSFSLAQGITPVPATVSYEGLVATLVPTSDLASSTFYTATITVAVTDLAGNAMESEYVWSFTTGVNLAAGPSAVELGTSGDYVALAKSGISTTGTTAITGDIGVSPAAATYITGFSLSLDASNVFSTSSYVTGSIYAADYAVPTPANLTTAIGDMETAYTDAAGRTLPDGTELYAGDLSGQTMSAGLYKWGTGVLINGSVTLDGGVNDVWIFQIAQDLIVGNGAMVTLSGGAMAKNVFWQVAGQTNLGVNSDFKGIILCKTLIEVSTGAVINGRLLAQTAVTLDANAVTEPAM